MTTASSYTAKYLRIPSYIRKPFLINDFATAPFWISSYMKKTIFSFLSVHLNVYDENVAFVCSPGLSRPRWGAARRRRTQGRPAEDRRTPCRRTQVSTLNSLFKFPTKIAQLWNIETSPNSLFEVLTKIEQLWNIETSTYRFNFAKMEWKMELCWYWKAYSDSTSIFKIS